LIDGLIYQVGFRGCKVETKSKGCHDGGRGREKVMFGTNGYGLKLCKDQFLPLNIKDETRRRVLRENAIEFLGLQ
jgi:hypothetical protein